MKTQSTASSQSVESGTLKCNVQPQQPQTMELLLACLLKIHQHLSRYHGSHTSVFENRTQKVRQPNPALVTTLKTTRPPLNNPNLQYSWTCIRFPSDWIYTHLSNLPAPTSYLPRIFRLDLVGVMPTKKRKKNKNGEKERKCQKKTSEESYKNYQKGDKLTK